MKVSIKTYSSQKSLIGSIIFLCIGGIIFTNASKILDVLAIGLGILFAVLGLVSLIQYGKNSQEQVNAKGNLIVGVISIIVAVIFIFFHDIVEQFIRFIIGGWILFIGIMRLINALDIGFKDRKSISLFIVSIALIILGIYTIIKDGLFLSTVGLVMMIYSIVEIIGYIFYSKEELKQEREGTETIIVPEKIETKEKKPNKVKDAKTETKEKKTKTSKKNTTTKKSSTTKKTTSKKDKKQD